MFPNRESDEEPRYVPPHTSTPHLERSNHRSLLTASPTRAYSKRVALKLLLYFSRLDVEPDIVKGHLSLHGLINASVLYRDRRWSLTCSQIGFFFKKKLQCFMLGNMPDPSVYVNK